MVFKCNTLVIIRIVVYDACRANKVTFYTSRKTVKVTQYNIDMYYNIYNIEK